MECLEQIEKYIAAFKELQERMEPVIRQVEELFPYADKNYKLLYISFMGSMMFNQIAQERRLSF